MNKKSTILGLLKNGSLNRFEAERHGDHCLNSTISTLRKQGYDVISHWEQVPNRFGTYTKVKRYSITTQKETATEQNPIAI